MRPTVVPVGTQAKDVKKGAKGVDQIKTKVALELMERIEAERKRTLERYELTMLRIEKSAEREENQKKREEDRKKSELEQREQLEKKKVLKEAEDAEKKYRKEVEGFQALERRRWVIKTLNNKHKNLNLVQSLANHNGDAFQEAVSNKLMAFKKEVEVRKNFELRMMDTMERVCREVELPKRAELDRLEAERAAEASILRRKNFAEQHRRDWESNIAMRAALLKFQDFRAKKEKEVADLLKERESKLSKRDIQEELLRKEKEERERQASTTTQKAEATEEGATWKSKKQQQVEQAVEEPKTETQTEASTTAPSGGAWKPKQKAETKPEATSEPTVTTATTTQPPSSGGALPTSSGAWKPKGKK